jgi:hypothetical protein
MNNTPPVTDDIFARAQALIITQDALHVLGPAKLHIARVLLPELPMVNCPIVDISALDASLDEDIAAILSAHVHPFEIVRVEQMIAEFEKIGAVITHHLVTIPEEVEYGTGGWFSAR